MRISTHFTGRAGEYAVASQLLVRGIPVYFPAVDTGVDLIAGRSIRIQIKSSSIRRRDTGGYAFTLTSRSPIEGHKVYRHKVRDWTKCADFMVFWGIDENRFWVIPSNTLREYKQVQTLLLGSSHRRKIDHGRIRELLDSGMRQCDVARLLGVGSMTVSEVSRGTVGPSRPSVCMDDSVFENNWDSVLTLVSLTEQVDEVEGECNNYTKELK
jgi:hypothetical protein